MSEPTRYEAMGLEVIATPTGEFVLWEDYARLNAELASLRSQFANSEWQPIETAPKDGTWIMCKVEPAHHGWEDCIVLRYRGDEWGRPGMVGYKPTHWMPLPKPPLS